MCAALLFCLLFQDDPAELLRSVESHMAEAKTLSVRARIKLSGQSGGKETRADLVGTLKSKGDALASVEIQGTKDGKPFPRVAIVSDGSRARYVSGGEKGEHGHQLKLGTMSRRLYVRAGLFGSAGAIVGAVLRPGQDPDRLFVVTDAAFGPDETIDGRTCRSVTYSATPPDPAAPVLKCTVWIDPARRVIVKRETTSSAGAESATYTEVYTDIALDEDIPDSEFQSND